MPKLFDAGGCREERVMTCSASGLIHGHHSGICVNFLKVCHKMKLSWISYPLVILFFTSACVSVKSQDLEALNGRKVFARVCQHTELKGNSFRGSTTNYVGLPNKYPPGSVFTFERFDGRFFIFQSHADSSEVRIEYVRKHSLVSPEAWLKQNFSFSELEPIKGLSDLERKQIEKCEPVKGMSRAAFFMAMGYPARSNNASFDAPVLRYSWKRFNNINYYFSSDTYLRSQD